MPQPLLNGGLSLEFAALYRGLVERAFEFEGCQGRRTCIPVLPQPELDVKTLRNPFGHPACTNNPIWCIVWARRLFRLWRHWVEGLADPEADREDADLCTCPWHLPYLSLYVSAIDAQGDFYDSLCDLCGVPRASVNTDLLRGLENPSWQSLWRRVAEWSTDPTVARAHYIVPNAVNPRYVGYALHNRPIGADELLAIRRALREHEPTRANVRHAVEAVIRQAQLRGAHRLPALLMDEAALTWLVQLLQPPNGEPDGEEPLGEQNGARRSLRLTAELQYSQLSFVGWTVTDDEGGEGTCQERPVKWGGRSPWLRHETGPRLNALTFPEPTNPVPLCGLQGQEPHAPLLAVDDQLVWRQRRVRILVPQDGCFVESYSIPHDGDVLIFKDAGALLPVVRGAATTRLDARGVLHGVEVHRVGAAHVDVGAPWRRSEPLAAIRTDGGIRARGGASPYLACALPRVIGPHGIALGAGTNDPNVRCHIDQEARLVLDTPIAQPLRVTVTAVGHAPVAVEVEVPTTAFPPDQLHHAVLPEQATHLLPDALVGGEGTLGDMLTPSVRAGLLTAQVVGTMGEVARGTAARYLQEMGFVGYADRGLRDLCDLGHVGGADVSDAALTAESPVLLHCGQGREGRLAVWLRGALDWWKLLAQPAHEPFGISCIDLLALGDLPSRDAAIAVLGTPDGIRMLAEQLRAEIRVPAPMPGVPQAEEPAWQPTQMPFPLEVFNPFNPAHTLKVHGVADWARIRTLLGDTLQVLHRTDDARAHAHQRTRGHQAPAAHSRWAIGHLNACGLQQFWLPSNRDTEHHAMWRATADAWRRLDAMTTQWERPEQPQYAGILVQGSSLIIPNRLRLPSHLRRWMSELTGMLPRWLPRSDPTVAPNILRWQEQPPGAAGAPIGWLPADRGYRSYALPTPTMASDAARRLAEAIALRHTNQEI